MYMYSAAQQTKQTRHMDMDMDILSMEKKG
jgi:hypothetical protein